MYRYSIRYDMYRYSIRYELPCKPLLLTDALFFASCDGYVQKWRRIGSKGEEA